MIEKKNVVKKITVTSLKNLITKLNFEFTVAVYLYVQEVCTGERVGSEHCLVRIWSMRYTAKTVEILNYRSCVYVKNIVGIRVVLFFIIFFQSSKAYAIDYIEEGFFFIEN